MSRRRRIARVLLACLLAAALVRLASLGLRFGRESLQADFAAFYTAGQAVRAGLSPYWTYPDREPPIWDGLAEHGASRYLYPPLFATLMEPLAALPYFVAKHVWMAASLAAVAVALVLLARALRPRLSIEAALGLAAFVAVFHPLVTHLERGQVDAFTLLAISAAIAPLVADGRDRWRSGLWLALGTVLKPSVAALVPFVLLRHRWRMAGGWALGGLAAGLLTVALFGVDGTASYLTRELPRISAEGEPHGSEGRLAPDVLARLRAGAPEGSTVRDGRVYRFESFRFLANASLARPLKRRLGLRMSLGRLSWVLLALMTVGLAAWLLGHPGIIDGRPLRELAWWQVAMAGVLLCWPVTWSMNVVWLLPAALIVIQAAPPATGLAERTALALCALGLVLAALPDAWASGLLPVDAFKYVVAELLVAGSLLAALARLPDPAPS